MGSGPISVDKTSLFCVSVTPEGASSTIRWSFSDALEFDLARRNMHFHRRPRLDAAGQSNSLTGCLSTGGQNWTPLDKPNSLSGCLSTGGQDWTPLDKSNSLSGCLSNGGHGWTPLDKSNFALRVLVQWRPRLDDAGQVKFAFRALVHRRPGLATTC